MHLKTLTLIGFKSFADRTRIECEPGVTVVVGPNGSGKSNLVDAIAWAMGTQATTSLRTQKMEDVIFAGTAARPAVGRAEVSLTFDNESGLMGLDVPEVSVTRRLYRDGTSEYEINGTPCRLLDIQELLADSGVGRHQHVIVGQGRIDDILNAAPDEHRAVIEEAAGVIKHRRRRERAVRRLEATDEDIVRVREVLADEERRLRPLKRQARAAERYHTVRADLRAMHLWLGGERIRAARTRLDEIAAAEAEATARLDEASTQREQLAEAIVELQASTEAGVAAVERDGAAAARLETTAERLHSVALVAKERRIGLERSADGEDPRRQNLRGEMMALEAAATRDASEHADLTHRRAAVAGVLTQEEAEAQRLAAEASLLDIDIEAATALLDEKRAAAAADRTVEAEVEEQWHAAESSAAAAEARLSAFRDGDSHLDEATQKAVSGISGVTGKLMARLDVPAGMESAVLAALGPWATAFTAIDAETIDAVAGEIRRDRLSGVAVVASDGVGIGPSASGDLLIDHLGPDADRALASRVLGDVVLADGWEQARKLVDADPTVRAVTRQGDLVTAAGVVIAGDTDTSAPGLDALRTARESAVTEAARAKSRHATARRAAAMSTAAEAEALEAVAALERRRGGAEEAARLVARSRDEHRAEMERLETRLRSLAEEASTRLSRTEEIQTRLHGESIPADGRVTTLDAIAATAERTRQIVLGHVATLKSRQRAAKSELDEAVARLDESRQRREHLGTVAETSRSELSALAVEAAELRVREESAAEGLRRDADATEEEALAAPMPEIPERTDPEAHLESLTVSLRRLGPVNPLAADEYEELSGKVRFMEDQLADLETSRSELRKVIRAVDEEITRLFVEAFEAISAKFAEHFALLFPGGTGRLTLTDPDDPMTTGVDIHAQPMGKKVGRLSLLSGGERSLAALAFLFAVFKARPSPFYVLDEVEAALDDANLRRFIRLVAGMRDESQLLIVTHQQQTMEAGDILYGVTMDPGESSRVLAKRLATV